MNFKRIALKHLSRKKSTSYLNQSIFSYFVIILFSLYVISKAQAAIATGSAEVMCKNKAKEIAAEMYKNCVTEVKQTQLKTLRSEYQQKMIDLKKHYEKELKKIANGQQATQSSNLQEQTSATLLSTPQSPAVVQQSYPSSDDNERAQFNSDTLDSKTISKNKKNSPSSVKSDSLLEVKTRQSGARETLSSKNDSNVNELPSRDFNNTDMNSVEIVEIPVE